LLQGRAGTQALVGTVRSEAIHKKVTGEFPNVLSIGDPAGVQCETGCGGYYR